MIIREFNDLNEISTGEVVYAPNKPDLTTNLVPVKYDGTKWIRTTSDDSDWYNYDKQEWANAVILKPGKTIEVNEEVKVDIEKTATKSFDELDIYAMFVWVPRFSYTIGCTNGNCLGYKIVGASELNLETPGAIDIRFISKNTIDPLNINGEEYPRYDYTTINDRRPYNWYTHPAFWWDNNSDGNRENGEELSGIWVGKFETSVNMNSDCYKEKVAPKCNYNNNSVFPLILPNLTPLYKQAVKDQHLTAQKFTNKKEIYNINGFAHMMKNSEWSAVAYLSQSIYGKYGNNMYAEKNKELYNNNNGSKITGLSSGEPAAELTGDILYRYDDISDRKNGIGAGGAGASTTGNIYGIYGMNGGFNSRVMGNFNGEPATDGFGTMPERKYFDLILSEKPFELLSSDIVGQAFFEVAGWYNDSKSSLSSTYYRPWIIRGGSYEEKYSSGIFSGKNANTGGSTYSYSFYSCLVYN